MSLYEEYLNKKNKSNSAEDGNREKFSPIKNEGQSIGSIDQSKDEDMRKEFLRIVDGKEDEKTDQVQKKESFPEKDSKPFPHVPSAPVKGHKLWARILAVCLIAVGFSVLSSLLWYWVIKTPKIVTETLIQEVEVVKIVPEIEPSFSFFKYDEFQDVSVTRAREIPVYLKQYLTNSYEYNRLIKVSIRNYTDDTDPKFLTLRSFFEALTINPPRDMYDKMVHEDFNIFIYSGEQNDIGFAFPAAKDSMTELLGIILANWDETIENDLWDFYSLVNPRGGEIAPPSTVYRRANIRCRSFRSAHHVCFTSLDNNFIITTSLESAKAVVDRSQ